mmetsp:Transcript_61240/g.108900  ORF Transcript_61240/g.108900 Transcript_61240/m.108900 type:complete len:200 (-) Transcript_61240:389-988(-)
MAIFAGTTTRCNPRAGRSCSRLASPFGATFSRAWHHDFGTLLLDSLDCGHHTNLPVVHTLSSCGASRKATTAPPDPWEIFRMHRCQCRHTLLARQCCGLSVASDGFHPDGIAHPDHHCAPFRCTQKAACRHARSRSPSSKAPGGPRCLRRGHQRCSCDVVQFLYRSSWRVPCRIYLESSHGVPPTRIWRCCRGVLFQEG